MYERKKYMIRFIIGIVFVVLYCILSIPLLIVSAVIRLFSPEKATTMMFYVIRWAFRVMTFISGVRVTAIGTDNIPENEAVLFVANHQSFFDVIIGYTFMKRRTGYIAKKSFATVPLLSQNMKVLNCLFLDREDIKQGLKTIQTAIEYVKKDISIFIFPEGTRNKTKDELKLADFHKGSFKIAQRTGCKIIPVSFNHTADAFENDFPRIRAVPVVVEFGAPVSFSDLSTEDQRHIDVYFRNLIHGMLEKNQTMITKAG